VKIDTALTVLRQQRSALASSALERLTEQTVWSEADLNRLLDLCDERRQPKQLDAAEANGQEFARAGERIDVRMESIERTADALGAAIDAAFAGDENLRLTAREALRVARRTYITAIARGFQRAVEGAVLAEHDRTVRLLHRMQAVQRMNSALNSGLDVDETLTSAATIISEELQIDLCAIFLYDAATNDLTLHSTNRSPFEIAGHYTISLEDPLTGKATKEGVPLFVRDAQTLQTPPSEAHLFDRPYRGILVVPIIYFASHGSTLEGAITVLSESPREFATEEIGFLELLAGQLAMSIENSHIYRRTDELVRQQISSIKMLQRISATVATSFDLSRVLQMIVSQSVQSTGSSHGAVFQFDPAGKLRMAMHHQLDIPSLRDKQVSLGDCCIGRAAEKCDSVWGIDCMHTDGTCFLRDVIHQLPDVHASLAVPLLSKGQMQGILYLLSNSRHFQPSIQVRMVETLAHEAAVAIESFNLYEETLRALEMKSHLLQEMHHRVKNNMLSISAILRMERRRTAEPEARRVLSESISRIDGMAAIHDLLSREERIGAASVGDIIAKLIGIVSAHLVPPTLKVDFQIRAEGNVEVHSKKALVLALVLNELLANAIEHGMEHREEGRVRVGTWEEEGQVHLVVADDGSNTPADVDFAQLSSLGLPLVRDMTRDQLRGTFTLLRAPLPSPLRDARDDDAPWTQAALVFPAERDQSQAFNPPTE
jgi:two-component system, sensor histidine kinase PdtaS